MTIWDLAAVKLLHVGIRVVTRYVLDWPSYLVNNFTFCFVIPALLF